MYLVVLIVIRKARLSIHEAVKISVGRVEQNTHAAEGKEDKGNVTKLIKTVLIERIGLEMH